MKNNLRVLIPCALLTAAGVYAANQQTPSKLEDVDTVNLTVTIRRDSTAYDKDAWQAVVKSVIDCKDVCESNDAREIWFTSFTKTIKDIMDIAHGKKSLHGQANISIHGSISGSISESEKNTA